MFYCENSGIRVTDYFTVLLLLVCLPVYGEEESRSVTLVSPLHDFSQKVAPNLLSTSIARRNLINAMCLQYDVYGNNRSESYLHKVVAYHKAGRFYHFSSHHTDWLGWSDDPFQQESLIVNDEAFYISPFNRCFKQKKLPTDAQLPGTLPYDVLYLALGWWPFEKRPVPLFVGKEVLMPSLIGLDGVSRAELEEVNGERCWKVSYDDYITVWYAPDSGWSLVRSSIKDPSTKKVAYEVDVSHLEQVSPFLWLPTTARVRVYDYNAEEMIGSQRILSDITIIINEVLVNKSVEIELFRPKRPPGVVRVFDDDSYKQVKGEGYDYLNKLSLWIRANGNYSNEKSEHYISINQAILRAMTSFIVVILLMRYKRMAGTDI